MGTFGIKSSIRQCSTLEFANKEEDRLGLPKQRVAYLVLNIPVSGYNVLVCIQYSMLRCCQFAVRNVASQIEWLP